MKNWLLHATMVLAASPLGCDSTKQPGVDGDGRGDAPPSDRDNVDSGPLTPVLFVSAASGVDDPAAGLADRPFRTLTYAISRAQPPAALHVAAGDYVESVVVKPGVSVLGGFAADNWQDRNVLDRSSDRFRTTIRAAVSIGITAGTSVLPDTLIEGLDVHGGRSLPDHHSYGIYLWDGGSPTIRFNTIEGGTGDIYGNGIGLFGSAAVIVANTISGGDATITYGIRSGNESTPLVAGNVIDGNSATDTSYGLLLSYSSPIIVGNTIGGGSSAAESYAIFIFGGSSPTIDNNILTAGGTSAGHCIYELAVNCRPSSIRTNDFFDCTTALYRAFGAAGTMTDIVDVNALAEAVGNVAVDPGFSSPQDWHLTALSPQVVREGGTASAVSGAAIDHDGIARSVPWSMGAFEQDGH
jgi:hypothetical protein